MKGNAENKFIKKAHPHKKVYATAHLAHLLLAATAPTHPKPKAKEPNPQRFIRFVAKFYSQSENIVISNTTFDKLSQNKFFQKMDSLGNRIKQLREQQELPLRTVAAYLDIDQAILSKIEHGHRKATREQVVQLAKYFKTDEKELLVIWLSDKLAHELKDEDLSKQALKAAEKKVDYLKKKTK